jgi:histidinol-phosphatase (PHP family)
VTKFDEKEKMSFPENERYWDIAEKYTRIAMKSGSFFEVNTGLITRGYRTTPCPHERLLRIIYEGGGSVVLSSDSHAPAALSAYFDEAKAILRDVGFKYTYVLKDSKWVKNHI